MLLPEKNHEIISFDIWLNLLNNRIVFYWIYFSDLNLKVFCKTFHFKLSQKSISAKCKLQEAIFPTCLIKIEVL